MPETTHLEWTNDELQRAMDEVIRRTQTDGSFRNLAISDGAAAFAKVNPRPLPPGLVFKFVDNSNEMRKTIPLPDALPTEDGEITEAELEMVAGGVSVSVSVTAACVGVSVGT